MPLKDCEKLYKDLSTRIFTQTTFKGATSLFMKNSYYDSDSWTQILKENMGETSLIETARDPNTPKVCIITFCISFRINLKKHKSTKCLLMPYLLIHIYFFIISNATFSLDRFV